jgi:hypothetical protein
MTTISWLWIWRAAMLHEQTTYKRVGRRRRRGRGRSLFQHVPSSSSSSLIDVGRRKRRRVESNDFRFNKNEPQLLISFFLYFFYK